MLTLLIISSPIALQGILMVVDEFYFHRRRGLPPWERIGHPLDTATVMIAYWIIQLFPPEFLSILAFGVVATFSALLVTKDEWIHSAYCGGGEQWMHSLLFLVHPLIFISAFLYWPAIHHLSPGLFFPSMLNPEGFSEFAGLIRWNFVGLMIVIHLFFLYQVVYWNLFYRGEPTREDR